jgi:predicted MPP superfamily phosphohydrolase
MPWPLRMTLYSFMLVVPPYVYVGWRLSRAMIVIFPAGERLTHWIVPLLMLALNIWTLIILFYYFTNQIPSLFLFKPSLNIWDYLILYPFWLGLIIIAELVPYYLCLDVVHILINMLARDLKDNLLKLLSTGKIIFLLVLAIYVVFRSYRDTNTIRINKFDVQLNKKLPGLDHLDLLLVADIQVDRYTGEEKLKLLQQRMDACHPDILFFAGDLVTGGRDFIDQGVDFLCASRARLDRIACLGDHDIWSDAITIGQGLKNCGWQFIQNGHYLLEYHGYKIVITVITHVYSQRIGTGELHSLLSTKPLGDIYILLVHQPATWIIQAAVANGYDIFLAGHTHGGQVVFRPFGISITPSQVENPHYSGYEKVGNLNVFVTNGIGLTMMPLRYNAPAEVLEIKISSPDNK